MLDFHILLDLLCEWDTLIPKWAPLLQIAHFAIWMHLLVKNNLKQKKPFSLRSVFIIADSICECKYEFQNSEKKYSLIMETTIY